MARSDATVILSRAFVLWCAVIAIAALYFAKEVLLPLALAILLSFLLAPLVTRLEKWGSRRIPAVLVVVAIAFSALGGLGYLLVYQIYDIAYRLPEYKDNIVAKVESFQGRGDGVVGRVSEALDDVKKKITHKETSGSLKNAPSTGNDAPSKEPKGVPGAGTPTESERLIDLAVHDGWIVFGFQNEAAESTTTAIKQRSTSDITESLGGN